MTSLSNFNICQFVTDRIVAALEKGVSGSYQLPWDNMSQSATHAVTKRRLNGITQILCQLSMVEQGFKANRWLTFKAAKDIGGCVIPGSKATKLCWLRPFMKIESNGKEKVISPSGEALSKAFEENKVFWSYRFANYFNVAQISDLEDHFYLPLVSGSNSEATLEEGFSVNDHAEAYIRSLQSSENLVLEHKGLEAYYAPQRDAIVMPEKTLFFKEQGYYATLFHELGHWSGAASRLNRPGIVNKEATFGSDQYAFEELIAELVAAFKLAEIGIERTVDESHVHYISSWLRILKADNKAIFRASQDAMKAVNYLNQLVEVPEVNSISPNLEVAS